MLHSDSSSLYEGAWAMMARLSSTNGDPSRLKAADLLSREEIIDHFIESLKLEQTPELFIGHLDDSFIETTTSTPLVIFLCELTMFLRGEEPTPMETHILKNRCTLLLSLPERISNIVRNELSTMRNIYLDMDLLITRICQSVCCLLLVTHRKEPEDNGQNTSDSPKYKLRKRSALIVLEVMIESLIRRGYIRSIFECFTRSLRNASTGLDISSEIIAFIFELLFKCSFKHRVTSEKWDAVVSRRKSTPYWTEWISGMLLTAEKDLNLKNVILTAFVFMLTKSLTLSPDQKIECLPVSQVLEHEIFVIQTCCLPTKRDVLRLIFRRILPDVLLKRNVSATDALSNFEEDMFAGVLQSWSSRDIVEKGSLDLNSSLANSVLYILLHIKERGVMIRQSRLLNPLLAGVSVRFEIVRSAETISEAITVASAFATFFVKDSEAIQAFSKFDQSTNLLEKWIQGEANLTTTKLSQPESTLDKNRFATVLFRRSVEGIDNYPLNPDEDFLFFTPEKAGLSKNSDFNEKSVLFTHENVLEHNELISFGKTKHEKDNLDDDIEILETLRQSFNAIVGIGRSTNAQINEVQQGLESGLRGFSRCLTIMKEKLGIWKERTVHDEVHRSREKYGRELNPMIPTLLPALMTLTIHAPEKRHNELMALRFSTIVLLIVLSPELTLSQLSKMLYASQYGVFQRVEIAKAVGEAAQIASKIEVKFGLQDMFPNPNEQNSNSRRIYPPIPSFKKDIRAIIVTEGKETRRWGNAVEERANRKDKVFFNYLADVAKLCIWALLDKSENDHFAFFRDTDPYVPAEVLRSIGIVLKCVSSARHVAPALSEEALPFVLAVVSKHPLSSIRCQGWILLGELMRCWCGAGALVVKDNHHYAHDVFGGSLSYVFSEKWMETLQALQVLAEKTRDDPTCAKIAFYVLIDLQELVMARKDFEVIENRLGQMNQITLSSSTD